MKKMSRWTAALLALVLALGCVQMASAETASDLPEVDLIYWCGCNPDQKDAELVLGECYQLAKDALNVNLKMVIVAVNEYKEKFNKAMAAQERIDLTWTGYVQPVQELVNLGALMPLDDLLAEYGQDLVASIDARLLDAHRCSDGLLYQFPAWQGMVGGRSYLAFEKNMIDATVGEEWLTEFEALMYEKWDKATVEDQAPVWDKMEELLAAAKEADVLGLGYNSINEGFTWYYGKCYGYNANSCVMPLWDETFTVTAAIDDELTKYRYQKMAEWFDAGYIRADVASIDKTSTGADDDANTKNYYIPYTAHNGFTEDLSKELAGKNREKYAIHTNPYCFTTLGNATGTSIPFTCAEPERAMMFMNWLVSDDEKAIEFYNTYAYGIEGKHYEWNEDHTAITVFGGDGQATGDFDWGQRPWWLGTLLNAYSSPSFPAWYYEELIELQEVAYTSPLLGFSFDNSDVETEVGLLNTVNTEYGDMLNRGYLGVAGWEAKYEEYRDKLYAAGLQNVVDAVQEQLTAYITAKGLTW